MYRQENSLKIDMNKQTQREKSGRLFKIITVSHEIKLLNNLSFEFKPVKDKKITFENFVKTIDFSPK